MNDKVTIKTLTEIVEQQAAAIDELKAELDAVKGWLKTRPWINVPKTNAARKPQRNSKGFVTLSGDPAQRKAQLEALKAHH